MDIERTFHYTKTCHSSARIYLSNSADRKLHLALATLSAWGGADSRLEINGAEFVGFEMSVDLALAIASTLQQRLWQRWDWEKECGWLLTSKKACETVEPKYEDRFTAEELRQQAEQHGKLIQEAVAKQHFEVAQHHRDTVTWLLSLAEKKDIKR